MSYKKFNPYKDNRYPSASITLTIGCNVDDKPRFEPEHVWETAHKHLTQALSGYDVTEGEWQGVPETSVSIHIPLVWNYELETLLGEVRHLADVLEQDAIGVWDIYGGSTLEYGAKWYAKQNDETA